MEGYIGNALTDTPQHSDLLDQQDALAVSTANHSKEAAFSLSSGDKEVQKLSFRQKAEVK